MVTSENLYTTVAAAAARLLLLQLVAPSLESWFMKLDCYLV